MVDETQWGVGHTSNIGIPFTITYPIYSNAIFIATVFNTASDSNVVQDLFTWLDQKTTSINSQFYRKTNGGGYYSYLVIGSK